MQKVSSKYFEIFSGWLLQRDLWNMTKIMQNEKIPNLGIGIGLRPVHYQEILKRLPPIDWFEIISENFMVPQGQNLEFLEQILEHYTVVQHGVSLYIGSSDPLDFQYLKKLKALTKLTKTPWLSDHLSWGKLKNAHFHDLLPLPFTEEVADYVAERAKIVQDYLEIPFALENISSYATTEHDQMSEWEFYARVVEKGGISMMLDINNIYVSSRNHGFTTREYYQSLPLKKVIQIHLAGHTEYENIVIDSHDRRVCDEVWELYGEIYSQTSGVSTLLEWDEHFLSLEETWKEALKAKDYQRSLQCLNHL
jgi:uncharacterized protein (UPF0276 family)